MGERKMSSDSRLVKEGEGEGEGEDIWAKATKAADDLYIMRDTYFPPNPLDKISKLQSQSNLSLNLLDSIPLVVAETASNMLPQFRVKFGSRKNIPKPVVMEIPSYNGSVVARARGGGRCRHDREKCDLRKISAQ
ncbi:hypothetical protein NC652_023490 [Populus alba x Populus x berolinensis]|nr:hypothetical protein NC652_023490 [Populus alba x Populus x berolinensis]